MMDIVDREADFLPKKKVAKLSTFSQLTFAWFWKLASIGWKRSLTLDDLRPLPQTSDEILDNWETCWIKSYRRPYINFPKLLIVPVLCFKNLLIPAVFMNFLCLICQFSTPQILKYLLAFIQDSSGSLWIGFLIAVGLSLSDLFEGLFQQQYMFKMHLLSLRLKGTLMSSIYVKSLKLYVGSVKSSGEILSHATGDVNRMTGIITRIQMIWCSPLQVILALIFLWQLLGWAALAGLLVTVLFVPVNIYISKLEDSCQNNLMKRKDDRIKMINEVLNGIRVIKMYAWELNFEQKIGLIRSQELKVLRKAAILSSCATFSMTCAPLLVAVVSFLLFVSADSRNVLTPEIVFVSLSLFNLLRQPLNDFPSFISSLIQANVSRKRLEAFLFKAQIDDNSVSREHSDSTAISIDNGEFKWGPESPESILKNVNLKVSKGALIAVIGQVGSGKSALLSAILGEMYKERGDINVDGSIAYVPQQAWIRNSSVKHNVTFTRMFNQQEYERILNSCALIQDLELLPAGDETEIGEKGVNLSGGQKQRISLARSVYQDRDIYLLDDPLSAVDIHVGKHIFRNVLSSETGLLKTKTRILVTHSLAYLQYTDLIVIMKNGCIHWTGSYQNLRADSTVSDILGTIIEEDKPEGENTNDDDKKQVEEDKNDQKEPEEIKKAPTLNEPVKNGQIIKKEEVTSGQVRWPVYGYYMRIVGWAFCLLILLVFLTSCAFGLASNIWLAKWTSAIGQENLVHGRNTSHDQPFDANFSLFVYFAFGFGEGIFVFISAFISAYAMIRASRILHRQILHRLFRSPMWFFDVTSLGTIINRFSSDFDMVDTMLPLCIQYLLTSFLKMFAMLVIVIVAVPFFAIVILPLAILFYMIQKFFVGTASQLKRLTFASNSPVLAFFAESSQGRNSIRAYNCQDWFLTECHRRIDTFQTASFPNIVATRWLALYLQLVANIAIFAVAFIAVCIRSEGVDAGLLGLSVTYSLMITWYLILAVRSVAEVSTNIVSVERIKEYTELPSEADWDAGEKPPVNWPDAGMVTFSNYSTRYRDDLDLVLRNISLTLPALSHVGVAGRTGAGKSSLSLALLRLIEAAEGSISIDNVQIAKIGLHVLRSKIAIIPQDPVLFSDTLRRNLDPFGACTDQQLWWALEMAHLKSFVETLPGQLSSEIFEGGSNFSVGQRQLLCLARALLKKAKILILDEATAPVDIETERLILGTIKQISAECTVITVAHRINTILECNKILILGDGKVLEFGEPDVLLKNEQSHFHKMAKQSKLL